MIKIIILGSCERSDFLLAMCKVLARAERKVLFIDGTVMKSIKQLVPAIDEYTPWTEYEDFDVAYGFNRYKEAEQYFKLQEQAGGTDAYDFVIVNTDAAEFLKQSCLLEFEHHVILTNLEKNRLQQNEVMISSLMSSCDKPIEFIHIYYPFVVCSVNEVYVEEMYRKHAVKWSNMEFQIWFHEGDYESYIECQYAGRIDIKRKSRSYKRNLFQFLLFVSKVERNELKKAFKRAQRRA